MITLINYGLGNIRAFVNVYERLNIKIRIAHKPEDLKGSTKLILPGVGAFDQAMLQLNQSGLRDELEKQVLIEKVPVIGVCVGMQILAKSSDEGKLSGLGWIDSKVKLFNASIIESKTGLPHMGWNTIMPVCVNPLLTGFTSESRFYFLHSYYFVCNNPDDTIATTDYGLKFSCAVNNGNIYGVQFHPEKSHANGIQLLYNFSKL
jgi:glutamine amidotransferase